MTTKHKWQQVTIVGCGLIGSSFALALRRSGACERIAGWDTSTSELNEALALGVIDEVDHGLAAGEISVSDLIYLAIPVLQIVEFLRERLLQIKPGAIVTDAGSTKASICRAATDYLPESCHFIGGHPIAGSHLSGVGQARGDLFDGTTYILTTDNTDTNSKAAIAVKETIESFGVRIKLMTAADHDRALALVSHLPQLLSSALAARVEKREDACEILGLAGTGYRDMTRLADSSWTIWRDILPTNPSSIAEALDAFIEKLTATRDELRRCDPNCETELPVARALFERK